MILAEFVIVAVIALITSNRSACGRIFEGYEVQMLLNDGFATGPNCSKDLMLDMSQHG